MAYDRIVAVNEENLLPPDVRAAIIDSPEFAEASAEYLTTKGTAANTALEEYFRVEVTEPGSVSNDLLIEQLRSDAADDGGVINAAIKSTVSEAETVVSMFIPARDFRPFTLSTTPVESFMPNAAAELVGIPTYILGSSESVVSGGVVIPPSWVLYDVEFYYMPTVSRPSGSTAVNISIKIAAASLTGKPGLVNKNETRTLRVLSTGEDSAKSQEVRSAVVVESVPGSPLPQVFRVTRAIAGSFGAYTDTIHFLGIRLVKRNPPPA